ncbi:MAG TPA: hypothetical protein VNL70_06150 [Tepidisphaeraceae bacterium]|nr:hypothetical protein [Tepidisphaeraceae bacterium]
MSSTDAEEMVGSWKCDLDTAEETIGRHSKQLGSDFIDALQAIHAGKLRLMNTLLWFLPSLPPQAPKAWRM